MGQETIIANTEVSFKDFLFKDKRNRTILWIAAAAIVLQWAIFKYFYPFASYIHGDSFSYINAAEKNLDISTYLIGYSKFLRLFSVFNRTDYVLATFQYLFIQCSVLYLLFTLFYFYKPAKNVQAILLCFMVFNPLSLHLANLISSDGLFFSLSIIWVTLLLWIIHRPSYKTIVWHGIVLFIAFTIRYNAIIYPAIAIFAFALSKTTWQKQLLGLGLILLLFGSFIGFTMYKYKKLTGYWQYSPFSGWQLTNNALYTYRYVNAVDRKSVPEKFRAFDNIVRQYFDNRRDTKKFPTETIMASTFYMWSPGMPMFVYRDNLFKTDTSASELKKWASVGPFYKSYGLYIIKQYPWHFIKYFIWPNAIKYYAPPVEFLGVYNSGKTDVTKQTKNWFGYKTRIVKTRFENKNVWILNFYPILSGIINVIMLITLCCYISLKGWQYNPTFKKGILLASIIWLLNAGFTIGASSVALRFQAFPLLLTTLFAALLIDWMTKMIETYKMQEERSQQIVPNKPLEVGYSN